MSGHVLDAMALLALLENTDHAGKIEAILAQSKREHPSVFLSVVNWGEVYYSTWHAHGQEIADQRAAQISQLPIAIVDVDRNQAKLAAQIKAVYRLPYADAFAAALAVSLKAKLVTSDADFQRVASHVDILWLVKPRKR